MRYVYLSSEPPSNSELELNDVGYVLEDEGGSIGLLRRSNGHLRIHFLRVNRIFRLPISVISDFDVSLTGDRHSKKVCDRCFKLLNTSTSFQDNRLKKNNVMTKRPSCRSCRKKKDGVSIPTAVKKDWVSEAPNQYSIFECPICTKRLIVGVSKIVLDHNHHTGAVRGWLCESCNTGIGRFDDSPDLVRRAVDWLESRDSDQ
jgi:hypothetical protein